MDWSEHLRRLHEDLQRLNALTVVPDFLRRYWRLVLEHLERCEGQPERLLRLCEAALSYTLWHHKAMERLAQSPEMQMRYLVPLGAELRAGLLRLCRVVERYRPASAAEQVVHELLRAFCHYQLGNTEQVVRSLEAAWEQGAQAPLIAFALGYNRYRWALGQFARLGPRGEVVGITDEAAFEDAVRRALQDFERGLALPADAPTEALLHFWKGALHEVLGEVDDAVQAYERAKVLDPETYGEEVERRVARLRRSQRPKAPPSPPSELREERAEPAKPITDDELERWRQTVMEVDTIADLLRRMGGQSSSHSDN